ncbi:MAG TPA: CesT family type III secretion system chaperone [Acidisphaera sp.]|nr:CesT family type III secretion system chaperone [Acidisphaera sp.]
MHETLRALYAELAKAIGVSSLPADEAGAVQLTIGDDVSVVLFPESDVTLTIVAPVMALPAQVDYGRALWLLRRNHYDSDIAPFRVSCDADGLLVLWGRLPTSGLTGLQLAETIDAIATQINTIREEVTVAGAAA